MLLIIARFAFVCAFARAWLLWLRRLAFVRLRARFAFLRLRIAIRGFALVIIPPIVSAPSPSSSAPSSSAFVALALGQLLHRFLAHLLAFFAPRELQPRLFMYGLAESDTWGVGGPARPLEGLGVEALAVHSHFRVCGRISRFQLKMTVKLMANFDETIRGGMRLNERQETKPAR